MILPIYNRKRSAGLLSAYILLTLLLTLIPTVSSAQSDAELFARLDSLLANQPAITRAKMARINKIKEQLRAPHLTPRQEYDINNKLLEEYLAFKCDEAYRYATRNIQIAKENGWWRDFNWSTLNQVHILSVMALFDVAEKSLGTIHLDALETSEDSLAYYVCYSDLHLFGAEFTEGTPFYDENLKAAQDGRQMALKVASENTMLGATNVANYLVYNKDYDKAIEVLNRFMKRGVKKGTRDYSIITSDLAHCYFCKHNNDMRRHYLLLSAISDVAAGIRENNSLRDLASLLMDEGDYDRAYRYINYSLNDALFYGTRLRNMQNARLMPKIMDSYRQAQQRHKNALILVTAIISVISILLAIAIFFLVRFNRRFHKTARVVEEVNKKLSDTVGQLRDVNGKLNEESQIKEQYLSRFMEMSSTLIDRHEEMRKKANRLARDRKIDELYTFLKSNSMTVNDTKFFYENFDAAFLNIYPYFPEEVNKLMQPDSQFVVKDNTLNTELRILALLRLGIKDNNRIAAILRSSITTIYTYRSKMKARSLIKDDFEQRVASL